MKHNPSRVIGFLGRVAPRRLPTNTIARNLLTSDLCAWAELPAGLIHQRRPDAESV